MPLKIKQSKAIRQKLLTDSTSTDQELIKYFVEVVNITEKAAKEYVSCRNAYLKHPAFQKERDALNQQKPALIKVTTKPFWMDSKNVQEFYVTTGFFRF